MTKAEIERKKSVARSLYMAGMEQNEIADKLEVSRNTVSKWCTTESWKEQRAATHVTRPELVNKLLGTIDNLITTVNQSNDPNLIAGLADKLAKFSAVGRKLTSVREKPSSESAFIVFSQRLPFSKISVWSKRFAKERTAAFRSVTPAGAPASRPRQPACTYTKPSLV